MATVTVNQDWRVSADARCWTVERRRVYGEESKRPGEVKWMAETYHPTLDQALASLAERHLRLADVEGVGALAAEWAWVRADIDDALARWRNEVDQARRAA